MRRVAKSQKKKKQIIKIKIKNNINKLKNGSITCRSSCISTAYHVGFYLSKMSRQGICKQAIVLQTLFNLKLKQKATTLHTLRFKMACSPVRERKKKKKKKNR